MSVLTPGNTSASEALELYLNSHFSSAPNARVAKTPTEHSGSASSIQSRQNYVGDNGKLANYALGAEKVQGRSEEIPGQRNATSARTNVSSVTAKEMAQTSSPRESSSKFAANDSPAIVVGAYLGSNGQSSRSHQTSQVLQNRSRESEHAMSSSTSQLLNTLDKLRDKLKQPQSSTVQNPLVSYQSLPPTLAYLMSEQPQSVYQTDVQVFNCQNDQQFPNSSNPNGSQKSAFLNQDPRFSKACEQPRLQNVSKSKGGFSPMDFAKFAEEPISAAGLAIRPKFEIPPKITQTGNRKTSRSFEVSDKMKKGGNLRRSRSLNASSKRSVEKEVIPAAPQNVNWEADLNPDLAENNAVVTPRNEANVRSDHDVKTGPDQRSYLYTTTHKTVASQRQEFGDVSIASLNCSTCVPKPLKRRSASLDRAISKNRIAITDQRSTIPPVSSNPNQNQKATNAYKRGNIRSNDLPLENSLKQQKSRKPPKPSTLMNSPSLNYDETNIMKEFPSFKPLPTEFGSHSCQDLFVRSSESQEIGEGPEINRQPLTTSTQHASSQSKSSLNFDPKTGSRLSKESLNANNILKPNYEFSSLASEPKLKLPGSEKLRRNLDRDVCGNPRPEDTNNNMKSHIVPKLSLPSQNQASGNQLPPNESYVSAFDHVPLRCSTPRSLIPSSRPLSESSQGVASSTQLRPVTSLQSVTSSQQQITSLQPFITSSQPPITSSQTPVTTLQPPITSSQLPVSPAYPQITSSQKYVASSSQQGMKLSQPSLGMSDFESYKLLAMAGGDNWNDINVPSPPYTDNGDPRLIPPLSMLGENGQQPIDSLKNLVRDMTEVTSRTNRLADASSINTSNSTIGGHPDERSTVGEDSIITKSTLDALKLVERGSEEFQTNIRTHLDSMKLINNSGANTISFS